MNTAPLLNIDQAAGRLGVRRSWLRDAVTNRVVQHTRIGRHVRFSEDDLAAIIAAGKRAPARPLRRVS